MFDSHCHLNFKAFNDDASAIAVAMHNEGTSGLVVGCDSTTSRYAIDLAQTYPHLWASVGLHPTHVFDESWDTPAMKELALEDRVVAIGEVGLDFYRFPEDEIQKEPYIAEQYRVLREAIKLAKDLDKPMVIHSREAYDELITVLQEEFSPIVEAFPEKLNGTVHCFMGTWEQAQKLLSLNFMIGFTGVITYKDASPTMIEAATHVPLNRLLIETDAPYLTPEPYRREGRKATGKTPRNLPQYSREVAVTLAKLRQTEVETILIETEANARRLFRLEV